MQSKPNKAPFSNYTPSVFIVSSPFQLLCAIAAIRQLELLRYEFYILLPNGDVRNNQVQLLLDEYKIPYKRLHNLNRFYFWYYVAKSFFCRKCEYYRLFIGDIRSFSQLYIGLGYVSDYSDVVALDDGNITISFLNDVISMPYPPHHRYILSMISKKRKIFLPNNLLTIFSDIPNQKYNIEQLDLSKVVKKDFFVNSQKKGIFIVGTNVRELSRQLKISESVYIMKLENLMRELRLHYPEDTVYFMPHGRDNKNYGELLCQKYDCVFHRPMMMIELELLHMDNPPKAVFGYTSTALHTLKKIFPDTRVVNILFESQEENPFYKDYVICSEYYLKNGIELIKESLS